MAQKALCELFVKTGLPLQQAKVLSYLLGQTGLTSSMNLEHDLYMRQPQVSLAMGFLQDKGWVKIDSTKTKELGAPYRLYKLAVPPEKICNDLIKGIDKTLKETNDLKAKLRAAMIPPMDESQSKKEFVI